VLPDFAGLPPEAITSATCSQPRGWRVIQCPHGSLVWVPNRCRSCEGCFHVRRARVRARVALGLRLNAQEGAEPTSAMLTLTSRPGTSNRDLMRYWNGFRQWLRRRLPDLEYVCVKEWGTLHGMAHLHVIVTGWTYIHQTELSDAWRRIAGAFRVDIRRLYGPERAAASYASKYVSKALAARRDLRKVVTYSRGWPKEARATWRLTSWTSEGPTRPAALGESRELGGGPLVIADANCECVASLDGTSTDCDNTGHEAARKMRRLVLERTP